jgi:hypothetical protein
MIATRTLVPCVVIFVNDMPLKKAGKVLVLMAWPNLERMARELKRKALLNIHLKYAYMFAKIISSNLESIKE